MPEGSYISEPRDRDLIVRIRRSDCIESKAMLYERYARRVIGRVFGYGGIGPDDAKDLVQEIFLTAFSKLGDLEDPDKFGPWLLTIARNRCLKFFEERRKRKAALERFSFEFPAHLAGPEEEAVRELELEAVRDLIRSIDSEDQRGPIEDFYLRGLGCEEIARGRGLTVTAVTTRLGRFRAKVSGELVRRVLEIWAEHER